MDMEGIGFREALEQLAQKAGVQLKRFEKGEKGQENLKPKLFNILELATKWYEKNLWEGKERDKILKYLHDRGIVDGRSENFVLVTRRTDGGISWNFCRNGIIKSKKSPKRDY